MTKIDFKNLPDTTTPLNASNLNDMQDNIENAINSVDSDLTTLETTVNTNSTYSTNEQKIGKWIDGKDLYRKTLVFPNGNSGTTSVVSYTLSNYGITNVDNIFIVHPSYYSMSGRHYPFQFNDGTDFACNVTTTALNVTLGYAPISNSEFVITLEYTKTTD